MNIEIKSLDQALKEQTAINAAERPHHPFSPSKLQMLEANPNYVGEDKDPGVASLRGTAQHNAAEGHTNLDDPTLEDHEAEAVSMCKSYRDQIIAKHPGGTVLKEQYLPIDDKTFTFNGAVHVGTTAGYNDLAVISADELYADVVDWKFGLWSVEAAENNLQGIAYLLGILKKFPKLKWITVHFVMPHRDTIDFHTFSHTEFEALYLRVCVVVARALKAQTSGNFDACSVKAPSCLFCGNKGTCTSVADFAIKVGHKYMPLTVPATVTPSTFADVAQSGLVMTVAQLMEAWGKAMRAQITARTIEDDAWHPDGYLLRSRANREVVNEARVLELAKAEGVDEKTLDGCRSLTMTPVNAAIRALAGRGDKKAAEEAFREKLIADGCLVEANPTIFLERVKS